MGPETSTETNIARTPKRKPLITSLVGSGLMSFEKTYQKRIAAGRNAARINMNICCLIHYYFIGEKPGSGALEGLETDITGLPRNRGAVQEEEG